LDKVLIIIAGMPGTGKTRFANYLAGKLQKALICKDKFKEIIWDKLHYDTSETQKYGGLAYDLSFHFCEMLMKSKQTIIFESNFGNTCPDKLKTMVDTYGYKVITILFDGDVEVVHKRFVERDLTDERHPGLVSKGRYNDFEFFKKATQPCRDFNYGDCIITVDTTDFSKVSYDEIVTQIVSSLTKLNF
jgi:predicted kinase